MLGDVLARAAKIPFYQSRLGRGDTLPITTKEDLRRAYPFGLLGCAKEEVASYHESSGSEGKPVASYFSEGDWTDIVSRYLRNISDLRRSDTFFIKTPYSMVTTAHQAHRAAQKVGALVVPADNRSTNMPYARVVQLLRDLGVTLTWSLPSEVMLWRIATEYHGFSPATDFMALRGFWVAGEALSPGRKEMISRLWNGKAVYEDYGSTETGSLAGECARGNLHLWEDRVLFELWDEKTGEIHRTGRGRLVVTPLYREAMPLYRYLVDDVVEIKTSDCPCGSSLSLLKVFGRQGSEVEIQGRHFYPVEIEDAVYSAGKEIMVSLWRGEFDANAIKISYYALGGGDPHAAKRFERALGERLGVRATAQARGLESFIDPALFSEKLQFQKPIYLFPRRASELH